MTPTTIFIIEKVVYEYNWDNEKVSIPSTKKKVSINMLI